MCRNNTVCHWKCVFLTHSEPEGKEARLPLARRASWKNQETQKFPENQMQSAYRIPLA